MILARFLEDRSGNMAILFALGFAASAAVSVVAIDTASLYHERRTLQSAVDLAAISAISDLDRAADIAEAVLVDAGLLDEETPTGLTVTTGHYDPAIAVVANRFVAGATPINAVRVRLQRPGTLFFAQNFLGVPQISAQGTAAVTPEVSFSIGSRLASLNGGIANTLLSTLAGTTVSLNALDYTALATAQVDAFDFLDALALQLGVTGLSYEQVLALDVPTGTLASALSNLVTGTAQTALRTLARAGPGRTVSLDRMFSLADLGRLQLGSEGAMAGLSLSAMEVLSAAASLADGDRQATVAIGTTIPGVVSLGLDLVIGDPPAGRGWFAIGPAGTAVRTAQVRLRIRARLLGGPVLLGAGVNLPLWLDLASAEAQVLSATCPSSSNPRGSASIAVLPGAATLALGELNDTRFRNFGTMPTADPVRLIDVLLLRVTGSARVEARQLTPVRLDFSAAEIAVGTRKTARTQTLATSLATSLLSGMTLQVDVLGLGLSPASIISQAVRALVMPLAPTLDLAINSALTTLGLVLGEADVRVYGVRCHKATLVG